MDQKAIERARARLNGTAKKLQQLADAMGSYGCAITDDGSWIIYVGKSDDDKVSTATAAIMQLTRENNT
ncbi:hypothetical protein [Zymobacter sp. IVIA_5232.4 C2]|uniref:hypothetical protein n=1 Tax=Zymobacter sp. IVIA_5232.4 C2 TaxID=3394855 RepID=UPI0039C2188B